MQAVYITEFGTPENLEIREIPDPATPQNTQVLVRVKTAGLNRADLLQVAGLYPPPAGYSNNIPGLEFAGEVVEVGNHVCKWKAGDRVFGIVAGESQAELLLIDEALLAQIPENLSFIHAAAVPEAFITAHDAVFTLGGLSEGKTLLIHAVGSGVGLAGLQIAKAKGATVLGTSRTAQKLERCSEFGLDLGIATSETKFAEAVLEKTGGRGVDVILDLVGGAYFELNLASLAMKGRLILVGLTSGRMAQFNLGIALQKRASIIGTTLRGRSNEEKAEATSYFVDDVLPMLIAGTVEPNVDRVYPVNDVVAAYNYLKSNESFGKVVLEF
ncbi:MAG: NAD(P)H-quinone oxidoreductase [Pyrinomonadaceae bacterium]|nr:NAD(P)H-quinone oxidoreductase [Acidobacteriota bacterium]MBP7374962.1 NAD(P)H-quinone oxidoreductase [Pyrinomonadaceae bacterium]